MAVGGIDISFFIYYTCLVVLQSSGEEQISDAINEEYNKFCKLEFLIEIK